LSVRVEVFRNHWLSLVFSSAMSDSVSIQRRLALLLAALVFLPSMMQAGEAPQAADFTSIVPRNAFGLVPAAVVPTVQFVPVPEASPNILLTGVASFKGKKLAYLTVTTPGVKEAKYLKLGESERDGDIEVTSIDLPKGEVRLKDRGRPAVVNFIKNGATTVAAVAPPPLPGNQATVSAAATPKGAAPAPVPNPAR
jgi:hypothetical protein